MGTTQEEINQLVADTAANLTEQFGRTLPHSRFERGGGMPESALVKVTAPELRELLRFAIETGMEIEREGTT